METSELLARTVQHLERIYPAADCVDLAARLLQTLAIDSPRCNDSHRNHWDAASVVVISYGDSISSPSQAPLQCLQDFLTRELDSITPIVHVLPFFPFSSDDGFAVIDYSSVNESLGDWRDIEALTATQTLMADVVINHISSRSLWFENFKKGIDPGANYFIALPGDTDVSAVVRPRTSDLLNAVQTASGEQYVWCTFSPDQVDLNFANAEVLVEFLGLIRFYLDKGIRWFRLDAVAFLWKELGTNCIHLPQTHELIKLLRLLVENTEADAVLVTETNVPNRENLSYFGNGNEAHVIYNFSLPPLLLHTLLSGDCTHLKTWQMSMPPAQRGTAYLNFIASHDGIGVRPAEGLLSEEQLADMIGTLESFGARVSYRGVGSDPPKPYEINIALIDALSGTIENGPDEYQFERFVCAHTIMLALEGIPAFYLHSLLATPNDYARVEHTGRLRSINRHQWQANELSAVIDDPATLTSRVLKELRRRCEIRTRQVAFHPNATQYTLHLGSKIFAFWRQSIDREQSIFALANVCDAPQTVALNELNLIETDRWFELLNAQELTQTHGDLTLAPYACAWLTNFKA